MALTLRVSNAGSGAGSGNPFIEFALQDRRASAGEEVAASNHSKAESRKQKAEKDRCTKEQ